MSENPVILGVDPGTKNLAISLLNLRDSETPYSTSTLERGKDQYLPIFEGQAIDKMVSMAENAFGGEIDIVVIEKQFDRSPGKPLEHLEHVLSYEAVYIFNDTKAVITFAPTQIKKWVTGKGNCDESVYWRKVQKMISAGALPNWENQHSLEALIFCLMAKEWWENREDFPLKPNIVYLSEENG
jgi:Holliday junction resolvasome RuvABC endonuclease subunit